MYASGYLFQLAITELPTTTTANLCVEFRHIPTISVETIEDQQPNDTNENQNSGHKRVPFCIEWIRVVWKMRGVYSSFLVHSFDIATDLMVIVQWWNAETGGKDNDIENVDTKLMAQTSIAIILFHKLVSSLAIYVSERNLFRAFLQFIDLLIYQAILDAHKKIIENMNSKANDKKGKLTMCFLIDVHANILA